MAGEKLVKIMQQAALGAVDSRGMADVLFGEVTGVSPLKIQVSQKLELDENALILCRDVTDYSVDMTVNHLTEPANVYLTTENTAHSHSVNRSTTEPLSPIEHLYEDYEPEFPEPIHSGHIHNLSASETVSSGFNCDSEHIHGYTGRKTYWVHNGLQIGEKVILIRAMGGQKFVVIDRLG